MVLCGVNIDMRGVAAILRMFKSIAFRPIGNLTREAGHF
jgi:hypothetical protein